METAEEVACVMGWRRGCGRRGDCWKAVRVKVLSCMVAVGMCLGSGGRGVVEGED